MTDDWEMRACPCGAVLVWDTVGYKWANTNPWSNCPTTGGVHKLRGVSRLVDELREVEVSLR